jgi:hypothetical protein
LKLADWLQIISLLAVVVALLLNYRQARETAKQATEASKQVTVSTTMMRQDAYRQMTNYGANFNAILFQSGEDLLQWFLASRGIPTGTHEQNLRHMFMFVRMDVHESVYLSHKEDFLEDSAWEAWRQVLLADAATVEFRAVWRAACLHYVGDFRSYVDSIVAEPAAETAAAAPAPVQRGS